VLLAWLLAPPSPAVASGCPRITVFSREDCPHCADAKRFLEALVERRPSLQLRIRDVVREPEALRELQALAAGHGVAAPGVPAFEICGSFLVGFRDEQSSGRAIERLVAGEASEAADGDAVEAPLVGRIELPALGLPLFTILLGLVDGFNPCAMWVLLFLLSVLVNVRDRRRILVVAGTFVLVSGAAYFAFMAAWLELFLWVGVWRPAQMLLAVLAIAIGAVHVKDSLVPGRGPSLSISPARKPGLYARVRRIVHAETLPAALAGAFVLAVLVNAIELLCTAGIPALYTRVLTLQGLSTPAYYAYLLLYDAAYVLDDALAVTAVVVTLRRHKLSAVEGRWLQLVSGVVILALGLLLLAAPGWLVG
jgi:glutaredoxin